VDGISAHIGYRSRIWSRFGSAARVVGYVSQLRAAALLRYLDFGGGLGARYTDQQVPSRDEYAKLIASLVKPLEFICCWSRPNIIAPAVCCWLRVRHVKQNERKRFGGGRGDERSNEAAFYRGASITRSRATVPMRCVKRDSLDVHRRVHHHKSFSLVCFT